ncbi:hypothetical protein PHLCEN_2v12072 [Hermanssonia centrifuga]|uniref:Uncharacterized protein n=1 Tax=Hermanssonia centrifuga TaxID=98765 RepID=A0A2R6NJ55_9APHY|nr:hypothetical protein PHLCEN_2v12072 [Hermanssonia centrifuga]
MRSKAWNLRPKNEELQHKKTVECGLVLETMGTYAKAAPEHTRTTRRHMPTKLMFFAKAAFPSRDHRTWLKTFAMQIYTVRYHGIGVSPNMQYSRM